MLALGLFVVAGATTAYAGIAEPGKRTSASVKKATKKASGGRHALTYGYVKGKKFEDKNANGVKDPGESYLDGWTIKAYRDTNGNGVRDAGENSVSDSDSTDDDGEYRLTLLAGKYVVCETLESGWTQSYPANTRCGSTAGGWAVTVSVGQTSYGNDFGNYKKGKVSGKKWHDKDIDGSKDSSEPYLSGWTINAYVDANGNGVRDAGENTIADSDTTDSSGAYSLSLNPGKYLICEVMQSGWFQSYPANDVCGPGAGGHAVSVTSGSTQGLRASGRTILTGSSTSGGKDFGNYKKGSVSGKKWHDQDADGSKDSSEPYLSGWTINAYVDANGNGVRDAGENTIADSDVTDSNGAYTLELLPGKYLICEALQSGWFQSFPSNNVCGTGAGGYAVTVTSGSSQAVASSGRTILTGSGGKDFGNYTKAKKKGTKFHDLNANGAKDAGEPGLAGWTINAYKDANGNGSKDAGETTLAASAVTDANGEYELLLNPGKYVVCEVQQAGWTQSHPANNACGTGAGGWGISLKSGDVDSGNDFGNWHKATKSGTKFNDLNGNGVREQEPGLQNWTIRAYVDTNGDGTLQAGETTIAASATTDAGGAYSLSLNPGTYVVCEVAQAGWTQSLPANTKCAAIAGLAPGGYAVSLSSNQTESGNDFGNFQQATKSGTKFNDLNSNGVRDQNEPGLAGWTIRAYVDTNGDGTLQAGETTIAASATTDAGGAYSLSLNPGAYVVCEVGQAGWTQSLPANTKCAAIAGLAPGGWAITLASGQRDADNDFGNFQQATKTGVKFHDLNGNGARDAGEPGLSGWTIQAFVDTNGNGVKDAAETTVAGSAVTNASGVYTIVLPPGQYVVCEVLQASWVQSYPANNACGTGAGGWGITLAAGQTDADNDFGNFQKATKSGTKFHDLNGNGVKDQGEPGLAGWTIRAYADTNGDGTLQAGETTIAASTTTDVSGAYSLSLNPGKYVVCEVAQAGWTQSAPANTKCSAIAGLAPGGWGITLTSGQTDADNDFGNFQPATKTGMKFHDLNGNGAKDAGEPGLGGWTITAYVDANGNGVRDAGENTVRASAVTGAGGTYSLTLNPGRYVVCETQQAGWIQSYPANAACGAGSGGWGITLTSGQVDADNDFGNFQKATKTGTKFNDLNINGVREQDELGLAGWTMTAYVDANGNGVRDAGENTVAATAVTNASGLYSMSLNPGQYVVCEEQRSGWTQSYPANNACGTGLGGWGITLTSGQTDEGNDFGNWTRATKSGLKFNDLNHNGVRDPSEPVLPGWGIRAYVDTNGDGTLQAGETTIAASTVTDAFGAYSLSMSPGKYVVCEVLQPGWNQSLPVNTKCSAIAGLAPGGYAITVGSGQAEINNDFGNWISTFRPPVCRSLTINRHSTALGRKVTIKAVCKDGAGRGMPGERVLAQGAGVKTSGKTNRSGVVTFVIRPTRLGIVRFRVVGSQRCTAQLTVRSGFRPPLTGRQKNH
jgi:uncharacterized membrane protein